jgi:hypothetical protein
MAGRYHRIVMNLLGGRAMTWSRSFGDGLIERYAELFSAQARVEGVALASANAVAVVKGSAGVIHAVLLENPVVRVEIELRGAGIRAACPCDVRRRGEPCRHLWATLIKANSKGYLSHLCMPGLHWEFDRSNGDGAGSSWKTMVRTLGNSGRLGPRRASRARDDSRLVYTLNPHEAIRSDEVILHIAAQRRRKNGAWGRPRPRQLTQEEVAAKTDPVERRALELLQGGRHPLSVFTLTGPDISLNAAQIDLVIPDLCRTGRFFVWNSDDPGELPAPCTWDDGEAWQVRMRLAPEGKDYTLQVLMERAGETMDFHEPLLFLAPGIVFARDKAARFRFDGEFPWIGYLRQERIVKIHKSELKKFLKEIYLLPGRAPIELPEGVKITEVRLEPRPCLELAPLKNSEKPMLAARLSFAYGEQQIDSREPRLQIYSPKAGTILVRDLDVEEAARGALRELGFQPPAGEDPWADYEAVPERVPPAVAALLPKGWQISGEEGLFRPPGKVRMSVSSGVDWFDLDGGVEYNGEEVPLPRLLAAMRSGKKFVKLGDGTVGLLPEEWLKRQGLFLAAGSRDGNVLRFGRGQAALLDALLDAEDRVTVDETFQKIRAGLRRFEGVTAADAPAGFQGTLREYQRVGLGWMGFLREFSLGGCLADDMGLGKTIQVLAYLESRRAAKAGTSLIVVPRSLLFNWKAEAARFAPSLRIVEHWGTERARDGAGLRDADILLTTYGTLRMDAPFLKDVRFDCVILDEAQAIKNAESDTAKAARLLQGDQRLALSGTPIENHLGELWSLMEFLNPGLLGRASAFRAALEAGGGDDPAARTLVARAMRPFILRRTKDQVAPELPERIEQTISVELDGDERRKYDELKLHYQQSLLKGDGNANLGKLQFHVLEALLRLRQAACHPGLLDKKFGGESSSKLEVLLDRLREVSGEGHKALVFSQFTTFLGIVRRVLDKEGIPYEYLDGQTVDRAAPVKRFQEDPACRVFLVSLKAGGVGLNLTAAEYVFLLDPWWNPAVEAQAIDRTHRIGQTRRVIACRLVAKDTVEEKVVELQRSKRDLADAILGGDRRPLAQLNREDLQLLLS